MIESKCPKKKYGQNKFFADESIVLSALSYIAFGSYLGILFHRTKIGRVWPGMLETNLIKGIGRFFIQTLIPVSVLVPFVFVPGNTPIVV